MFLLLQIPSKWGHPAGARGQMLFICPYEQLSSRLPRPQFVFLFLNERKKTLARLHNNKCPAKFEKKKKVFNLAGHYFILIFIYYLAFRKMFFPSLPFSSRSLVLLSHK